MSYTVIISAVAEADLTEIFDYIAARAGMSIAARFVDRIEAYVMGFAHTPERGTRRDDLRRGLRTVGFRRRATILFEVDRVRKRVIIHGVYYADEASKEISSDMYYVRCRLLPYPVIVSFTAATNCFSVNGLGKKANCSPAGRLFSNASSA